MIYLLEGKENFKSHTFTRISLRVAEKFVGLTGIDILETFSNGLKIVLWEIHLKHLHEEGISFNLT